MKFPVRRRVSMLSVVGCVGRGAVLASAMAVAGCASDAEQRREAAAAAHASQVAAQRRAEVELEDDGLPSQVPPPMARRREPDDPREPFSPNYGRPVPQPPPPAQPQRAAASDAMPSPALTRVSATYR